MTTFTIAYTTDSGVLLACVPDGADIEAAVAREMEKIGSSDDTPDYTVARGLTLTDEFKDTDRTIYSGYAMGWLTDENAVAYKYAVRR